MNVQDMLGNVHDAMSVRRVFGEPIEKDGVTLVPTAALRGGAGGGEGEAPEKEGKGSGGGFGVMARPIGAYVIKEGQVQWQPVFDLNRVILGAQIVLGIGLLALRAIMRARAQTKAIEALRSRRRWRMRGRRFG